LLLFVTNKKEEYDEEKSWKMKFCFRYNNEYIELRKTFHWLLKLIFYFFLRDILLSIYLLMNNHFSVSRCYWEKNRFIFLLKNKFNFVVKRTRAHKKLNRPTRPFFDEPHWIIYQLKEHVETNSLTLFSCGFDRISKTKSY